MRGWHDIGGLVDENRGQIIKCGCFATIQGQFNTDDLVGLNVARIPAACHSDSTVSGTSILGGLVGRNHGRISSSYSLSKVSGEWNRIGGLVGYNSGGILNSAIAPETLMDVFLLAFGIYRLLDNPTATVDWVYRLPKCRIDSPTWRRGGIFPKMLQWISEK